jgi:hypothetical protein
MNDEELKKEIEDALGVEPTVGFVARVRRQIANEPRGRWMRLPGAAGGLAAAVLVGVVVYQPRQTVSPIPPTPVVDSRQQMEDPAKQDDTLMRSTPAAPQALHKPRRAEPEVLVDPREAAALYSFLEDVQEQKIDLSKLKGLFEAADKVRAVEDITPMPIADIEPIRVPALNSSLPGIEGGL